MSRLSSKDLGLRVGEMRNKIRFFKPSTGRYVHPPDDSGIQFVWGSFRTLAGMELYMAGSIQMQIQAELRIRYIEKIAGTEIVCWWKLMGMKQDVNLLSYSEGSWTLSY